MGLPNNTLKNADNHTVANKPEVSNQLLEIARKEADAVIKELESRLSGLSATEADARVKRYGLNEIAREKHQSPLIRLLDNVKNPLVLLLTALGVLSFLTGDIRATVIIFVMVVLGVVLSPSPGYFLHSPLEPSLHFIPSTQIAPARDVKD
jgi:Mg2+-importing ATPase